MLSELLLALGLFLSGCVVTLFCWRKPILRAILNDQPKALLDEYLNTTGPRMRTLTLQLYAAGRPVIFGMTDDTGQFTTDWREVVEPLIRRGLVTMELLDDEHGPDCLKQLTARLELTETGQAIMLAVCGGAMKAAVAQEPGAQVLMRALEAITYSTLPRK